MSHSTNASALDGVVASRVAVVTLDEVEGGRVLLWSLMLGAGLLFGDGMITPAISVLSAVEGLEVATPAFAPYILPITIALLTGLFAIQFRGTSGIGVVFGPLLIVWFAAIAAFGFVEIARNPAILMAFDPTYGIGFLLRAGPREALLILSALMLVVTGGEAMYADLGHFGARPSAWRFSSLWRRGAGDVRRPLMPTQYARLSRCKTWLICTALAPHLWNATRSF